MQAGDMLDVPAGKTHYAKVCLSWCHDCKLAGLSLLACRCSKGPAPLWTAPRGNSGKLAAHQASALAASLHWVIGGTAPPGHLEQFSLTVVRGSTTPVALRLCLTSLESTADYFETLAADLMGDRAALRSLYASSFLASNHAFPPQATLVHRHTCALLPSRGPAPSHVRCGTAGSPKSSSASAACGFAVGALGRSSCVQADVSHAAQAKAQEPSCIASKDGSA